MRDKACGSSESDRVSVGEESLFDNDRENIGPFSFTCR